MGLWIVLYCFIRIDSWCRGLSGRTTQTRNRGAKASFALNLRETPTWLTLRVTQAAATRHKGVGLCRRDEHRHSWRLSPWQPGSPRWRVLSKPLICQFLRRHGMPLDGAAPAAACTGRSSIIENCGPPMGLGLIRAITTRRSRVIISGQYVPTRGIGYRPIRYPDPFGALVAFQRSFSAGNADRDILLAWLVSGPCAIVAPTR